MAKNYPLISGYRRKPNKDKDGGKNYGKPCVICGAGTCGELWVQYSYMRGEDETVRVCADHWKIGNDLIIEKMFEQESASANLINQQE